MSAVSNLCYVTFWMSAVSNLCYVTFGTTIVCSLCYVTCEYVLNPLNYFREEDMLDMAPFLKESSRLGENNSETLTFGYILHTSVSGVPKGK